MNSETLCEFRMFAIEQAMASCGQGARPAQILAVAAEYLNFILAGALPSSPTVH